MRCVYVSGFPRAKEMPDID